MDPFAHTPSSICRAISLVFELNRTVRLRVQVTYITLSEWLIVIDDNGVPVFYKRESNRVTDFKLHPSGERSYAVRTGYLQRFRYERSRNRCWMQIEEVDRVTTIGLNQTDNHDFLIRENGNYVLLSYHGETRDLTDYGGGPADPVIESVMQEITRDRELVFQWRKKKFRGAKDCEIRLNMPMSTRYSRRRMGILSYQES